MLDRMSVFAAQHLRFIDHDHGLVTDTLVRSPFLTPGACSNIIRLAEAHANSIGGWTCDQEEVYEQTTTDIEVDCTQELKNWLREISFVDTLQRLYMHLYGKRIVAFNDVFIIKYSADAQRALVPHTDAGDLSFMIALNNPTGKRGLKTVALEAFLCTDYTIAMDSCGTYIMTQCMDIIIYIITTHS